MTNSTLPRRAWVLVIAASGCGSSAIGGGSVDARVAVDAPIVLADGQVLVDGSAPAGDAGCISGLTGITLAPAASTVMLDGTGAAPITFTATGQRAGGSTPIDATALRWSLSREDDTPPGTISSGGLFSPNSEAAGVVTVKATDGCVTGTTTVTFTINAVQGTPPAGWNGAQVMTGGPLAPIIVYPSDQTRFPRNVYRTLFQWQTGGAGPFRLIFTGPGGTYTVYTDGAHELCAGKNPAAACWETTQRDWGFIAGSNAGQTATVTVDRLDTSGPSPVARRSAAITLGFSRRDVPGAIFYWSTTSKGVRRGSLAAAVPEDYVVGVPPTTFAGGDKVKCVACHVVSRDGQYLAAPTESDMFKGLWVMEVTALPPPKPLVQKIVNTDGHGYSTFSPNDAYLVAAYKGKMWQLERTTGNKVVDLALGSLMGTHPDWSPDNTQLVFATGAADAPDNAGLALLPYQGGTSWGTPSVLVASAGGKTNLFPTFSFDGKWIAFSRGDKGTHDDTSMQLMMVRSTMGSLPVDLTRASCTVTTRTDDCKTENYEPTWAPPGDLEWIAFNSRRRYGVVLDPGTTQLWITAVDPSKVGTSDPSYPAFRVPFQGLAEHNHRAFWTKDIRETQPLPDAGVPDARPPNEPDARACVADNEVCDPDTDSCCGPNYFCDTNDDGATYFCLRQGIE